METHYNKQSDHGMLFESMQDVKKSHTLQLFIYGIDDGIISICVSSSDRVMTIKNEIRKKTNADLSKSYLMFGTKILRDDWFLEDYGISDLSNITILFSLR